MLSVEELNDKLIELAFSEDIGDGDHTTLCCIPAVAMGESRLLIKEEGVLAGVDVAKRVFHLFDPELQVDVYVEDGAHVKPGSIVMSVKVRTQSLLQYRTSYAQYHAAYEWYCNDDSQVSASTH